MSPVANRTIGREPLPQQHPDPVQKNIYQEKFEQDQIEAERQRLARIEPDLITKKGSHVIRVPWPRPQPSPVDATHGPGAQAVKANAIGDSIFSEGYRVLPDFVPATFDPLNRIMDEDPNQHPEVEGDLQNDARNACEVWKGRRAKCLTFGAEVEKARAALEPKIKAFDDVKSLAKLDGRPEPEAPADLKEAIDELGKLIHTKEHGFESAKKAFSSQADRVELTVKQQVIPLRESALEQMESKREELQGIVQNLRLYVGDAMCQKFFGEIMAATVGADSLLEQCDRVITGIEAFEPRDVMLAAIKFECPKLPVIEGGK